MQNDNEVNEIKNEIKRSGREVMSLEFITLLALIITTASGYVLWGLTTWVQVHVAPRTQEDYEQIRTFNQEQYDNYKNARKEWTNMRVSYTDFINRCQQYKPMSAQERQSYFEKNDNNVTKVKEATADFNHFFGDGLHKILIYELQWYVAHRNVCPNRDITPPLLLYREKRLMRLFLQKMYNPNINNPNFNNPYFMKYL